MSFRDFGIPEEVFSLPGGATVVLQGITLPDVTYLIYHFGPELRTLFDEVTSTAAAGEAAFSIAAMVSKVPPKLIPEIIALGAREPEAVDHIARLPFPLQVQALEVVGRLTFADEDGVKNFAETVTRVANGLVATTTLLQSPSTDGSENSEAS